MIEESILSNLKSSFSSAIQRIDVQSLAKTFSFRESSVREHSAFSKTVISNMKSQSMVYASTLSMIKNLCLEQDFNPLEISEFDRLKILVHLFSNNFFSKHLSIRCPKKTCEGKVKYSIKYGSLLRMMDTVDCSDIIFENSTEMGNIRVEANFPKTKRYLSLLENVDSERTTLSDSDYENMDNSFSQIDGNSANVSSKSSEDDFVKKIRMRRDILKGKINKVVNDKKDVFGNVDSKSSVKPNAIMDLADIYLKRIQISNINGSENEFDIDMSDMDYNDTEKILSSIPMNLFIKNNGSNAVKTITNGIFKKMNDCVPEIKCPVCGFPISKKLTLPDFFIFG